MSVAQVVLLVATGLLVVMLLAHFLLTRRSRSSVGPPVDRPLTGPVFRDDPRYWVGGFFYYNPDDPDLMVPKRFGFGLTFNWGYPKARLVGVALLLIPLALAILQALVHH